MTDNVVHLFKDPPPTTDPAPAQATPIAPTPAAVPPQTPDARPQPVWRRSGRAVVRAVRDERTRTAARARASGTAPTWSAVPGSSPDGRGTAVPRPATSG